MKYILVVYFLTINGTDRVEFVRDLNFYDCKALMHQTHFTLPLPQNNLGYGLNCEPQEE